MGPIASLAGGERKTWQGDAAVAAEVNTVFGGLLADELEDREAVTALVPR